MLAKDIGIDLGTANVLIYIKGEGIVLNEPSVVAIDTDNKKVVAVGHEASEMLGRTPGKVKAIKPMKDGVIADFEITEIMLDYFIRKIHARNFLSRPRILICCPSNITPVEKNAIKEAAERTGARRVFLEEEPKVAAIGAGMDMDIAILSLNDIVTSDSVRIAGNVFDQDIIKYIREKYKLLIGEQTAEEIKIEFANIFNPDKKHKLEVRGRDLVTGLPSTIEITEEETEEALRESITKIIKAVTAVLEQTPPELSADIVEKGIILTGGGSMLNGLVPLLKEKLKVPVFIADSPLTCVVEGTGVLLDNIKLLENES